MNTTTNFRKPNKKAPRFRYSVLSVLNKEFQDKFKEKYPKYNLSFKDIKKIISLFNEEMWTYITKNREGIELPYHLGIIYLSAIKSKTNPVHYGNSIKYGQKLHATNLDTDGLVCKVTYSTNNKRHRYKFRECWGFRPTRKFRLTASKEFKENYQIYKTFNNSK